MESRLRGRFFCGENRTGDWMVMLEFGTVMLELGGDMLEFRGVMLEFELVMAQSDEVLLISGLFTR